MSDLKLTPLDCSDSCCEHWPASDGYLYDKDEVDAFIQSQKQRIEALSKVASEARGLLDSIQSGALSRNNCENLSTELIEEIDKALTDTTQADEGE